jgi:hypothetical protein
MCALLLPCFSALAQDELDEAPVTTLDENDTPSRKPKPTARSGANDAPAPPPKLSPEDDKRAREAFEQGRQAWDEGRFREAWEHWHLAYRLSRRPELLYNVGQAADRLRMDAEALEAFRLYLAKNPDAENRREVENRIRILEREVGGAQPGSVSPDYLGESVDAPPTEVEQAPEEEPNPFGQPRRQGIYVRGSAGFGYLADSFDDGSGTSKSAGSLTLAIDAGVGYGVARQWVIGGALVIDWSLAPTANNNGASVDLNTLRTTLISAFAVYHLRPQANGWHLLGGLGFGTLSVSDASGTFGNEDGGGLGLFVGGGYELPLQDKWALGVTGRLLIARFSQDIGDHFIVAPSVGASIVWY